jgi:hypothetical protein
MEGQQSGFHKFVANCCVTQGIKLRSTSDDHRLLKSHRLHMTPISSFRVLKLTIA